MHGNIRFNRFIIPVIAVLLCTCIQLYGGDVSLAWDPSTSDGVVGYKVYFGKAVGNYDSFHTVTGSSSHTVTDLTAGTYYFVVTAFDSVGNESGYSNEVSTVVEDTAISDGVSDPPDQPVVLPDSEPPVISSVAAVGISAMGATITWTTNEAADSQVEYGTSEAYGSSTPMNSTMKTSHSLMLSGLESGTQYHYRVKSKDAAGNLSKSADFTFTTPEPPDTTEPVISSVRSFDITDKGATVSWSTDEASDAQVEYGTTPDCEIATDLESKMQTSHSRSLSGLSSERQYYYRVKSKDAAGNTAVSGTYSFTTEVESNPPVISAVAVSGQTGTAATITWTTNEISDSQVEYGTLPGYGMSTNLNSSMVFSHTQVLTGLVPGTTYHFRVMSSNDKGVLAASGDYTFTAMKVVSTQTMPLFNSGIASRSELYAGMSLLNESEENAAVALTAFDAEGNMITGAGIRNPVVRYIAGKQQLSLVDVEIFGDNLSKFCSNGWIRMESTSESVRGFFMTFDGQMKLMDGVPFATKQMKKFVFTHIESGGSTGISLVNRNPKSTGVTIDLVGADGKVRQSVSRTINPNAVVTYYLFTDLFAGTTPVSSDYVHVSASNGVEPFQIAQPGSADIAFLNAGDGDTGAKTLYLPKYVYDKNYRTDVSIVNTGSDGGNVRIRLLSKNGMTIGAARDILVPGNGKLFINGPEFFLDQSQGADIQSSSGTVNPGKLRKTSESLTGNTGSGAIEGYVEIVSDGLQLVGSASYRGRNSQSFVSMLPLVRELNDYAVSGHVVSNNVYYTEMAVANPGTVDASVILGLFNSKGGLVEAAEISVPAGGQSYFKLKEAFGNSLKTNNSGGYVGLSSNTPVAAVSLFGARDQSVLSAAPVQ